jgi:hypothetical protein
VEKAKNRSLTLDLSRFQPDLETARAIGLQRVGFENTGTHDTAVLAEKKTVRSTQPHDFVFGRMKRTQPSHQNRAQTNRQIAARELLVMIPSLVSLQNFYADAGVAVDRGDGFVFHSERADEFFERSEFVKRTGELIEEDKIARFQEWSQRC